MIDIDEQIRRENEYQERRRAYIEQMTPIWRRDGEELRHIRESLRISRDEVSFYIGASKSVIARLEAGKPIQRRIVVETSYRTMLHMIPLLRQLEAWRE